MKILECARVDPSSGCTYVAKGNTVDDILADVAVHAKTHGIHSVTPELISLVKANIRDA
jgi:predicted small metal-binding protein